MKIFFKQHPIRPPNQQQNRHAQRGGKQEKTRVINLLHNRARIAAQRFGQQRHQRRKQRVLHRRKADIGECG